MESKTTTKDEDQPRDDRKRKRPANKKNRQRRQPCSLLRSNDSQPQISIVSTNNGRLLRVIHPYLYTFCSFAKQRWLDSSILEVYCREYGSYPRAYYEAAIAQGRIMVSDRKVSASYKIHGDDVLMHTVHRHEPAVAVASNESPLVTIVGETNELLAVDKPATMPVHPCGGYHLNSLVKILESSQRFQNLYPIHRLDRLTSGLVILAKSKQVAKSWSVAMQQGDCQKLYLARVKGRFSQNIPNDIPRLQGSSLPVDGKLSQLGSVKSAGNNRRCCAHGYWITDSAGNASTLSLEDFCCSEVPLETLLSSLDDTLPKSDMPIHWLNLACPVRVKDPKNGVCESGTFSDLDDSIYVKSVKSAQTLFTIVRYNEADDSTLLLVRPSTGRTHQIRLHLLHLRHSIANDPNYHVGNDPDMWFGDLEGKQERKKAQELLDTATASGLQPATEEEVGKIAEGNWDKEESLDSFVRRTCVWCARNAGKSSDTERAKLEFLVRSTGLWLHALQYKLNDASFRTELPPWANCDKW